MVPKRDGLGLFFLLLFCASYLVSVPAWGNDKVQTPSGQTHAIQTTTALVLVDALAQDKKTGAPIADLQQGDFLLRDNGKPVEIATFNRGMDQKLRPVQLWFVLLCNEELRFHPATRRGWGTEMAEQWGVSFLAGKMDELLPALAHLREDETIGVAHWCDNGESEVDMPPSTDRAAAVETMEQIARRKTVVVERDSSRAVRGDVTNLIDNVARTAFPEPFLAIIFVGGKQTGSASGKSADIWSGFMEESSMDFGLERGSVASDSGDLKYAVQGSDYVKRLGVYMDCLHQRYEFGFVPGKHEKKLHHVSVVLTKEAKEKHLNAVLRYREGYSEVTETGDVDTANRAMDWKQLDSRMRAAVMSPQNQGQLSFQVQRIGSSQGTTERFLLKIAPGDLTWSVLPNGDRRTVVTAVVASYSEKGQPVGVAVQELEIVQSFDRLALLKDKPVEFSLSAAVVKGAVHVRLLVRDVATGHIGTQDDLSYGPPVLDNMQNRPIKGATAGSATRAS